MLLKKKCQPRSLSGVNPNIQASSPPSNSACRCPHSVAACLPALSCHLCLTHARWSVLRLNPVKMRPPHAACSLGVLIGFMSAGRTHVVSHFLLKNRHRLCHCRHRHCHLRCRSLHPCALTKKEAAAQPPPVYQWQHHREHVYKSRQLGLI